MKRLVIIGLVWCLGCTGLLAQQGWECGGWIGVSNYFGDLNTNFDLSKPGWAAGAIARYNFNERLTLKFSGNVGNVSANDADSKNIYERARNLSFQSRILEGTAQFEFNFLPYLHGSQDNFFTPYLFAGPTVFNFNPQTEVDGELVELRPLGTEGQFRGEEYYGTQIGFAYGGGLKISVTYRLSLNIEIGARALSTDYLDDVSTVYADAGDIENLRGSLAAELSNRSIMIEGVEAADFTEGEQRGNAFNNDSYIFTGVSLLYYFGDLNCPSIVR